MNESINGSTDNRTQVEITPHPILGVLLSTFAAVTIIGNVLVMYAVARERHLRSVTNYFMVSLAMADLIIGGVVMPFGISLLVTGDVWLYGSDWCDVWHSFDVLASTASILNLSVIALDRYWAILKPMSYPTRMSTGKAVVLIAIVWICSSAISFPAILWWRAVTGTPKDKQCVFTEDTGYLIFSSICSFYAPVIVILFAYYRIFRAASEQMKSIKTGSKVMYNTFHGGQKLTLRIHRGGGVSRETRNTGSSYSRSTQYNSDTSESPIHYRNGTVYSHHSNGYHRNSDSINESPIHRQSEECIPLHHVVEAVSSTSSIEDSPQRVPQRTDDTPQRVSRTWRNFAISRKLSKIAKEQKAAKTLGIVMGVFCICWVPFFVTNVLFGLCNTECVMHADIILPIFTWLGYINSGMNPIIYACSMRDFRRAFAKIVCCVSSKRFKGVSRGRYHMTFTRSSSSVMYTDTSVRKHIVRNGKDT